MTDQAQLTADVQHSIRLSNILVVMDNPEVFPQAVVDMCLAEMPLLTHNANVLDLTSKLLIARSREIIANASKAAASLKRPSVTKPTLTSE
tara:strand:- start:306 stop:578 length:273 start_codon:yes stop_codon:yes gene_type:complete